jgi:hypothetical protein
MSERSELTGRPSASGAHGDGVWGRSTHGEQ